MSRLSVADLSASFAAVLLSILRAYRFKPAELLKPRRLERFGRRRGLCCLTVHLTECGSSSGPVSALPSESNIGIAALAAWPCNGSSNVPHAVFHTPVECRPVKSTADDPRASDAGLVLKLSLDGLLQHLPVQRQVRYDPLQPAVLAFRPLETLSLRWHQAGLRFAPDVEPRL